MGKPTFEVYGIPWYRSEDYATIRRIMMDGHNLPCSFAIWRLSVESVEMRLKRKGKRGVRVLIDPEVFRSWCVAQGLDLNATARMRYAGFLAKHHTVSHPVIAFDYTGSKPPAKKTRAGRARV